MLTRGQFKFAVRQLIWGRKTMGNKQANKSTARRAATFLAVLGALVMSSGVALVVASTPANAAQEEHIPVNVCHATSSDTNPYVFITVDNDATKLKGHLMHREDPNKKWKSAGTWNGIDHVKGDSKRDYIADYTDEGGDFHELDGNLTAEDCPGTSEEPEDLIASASVSFVDPTCAAPAQADFSGNGEHVGFEIHSGAKAAGSSIVVRAYTIDGASFADESNFKDFSHSYPTVDVNAAPCLRASTPLPPTVVSVDPPQTKSKSVTKTKSTAVTPTVVHAGLTVAPAEDLRGEQGLALMVAGMVMLMAAGGLGLRLRGAAARI